MVSAENDMMGDTALCHRLPALLETLRPLVREEVLTPPVLPDVSPERIAALTELIIPLHIQEWENGCAINVWDIAGLKYNEGRNSAILAWLLDPRGTHGLGTRVISHLLRLVCARQSNWPELSDCLTNVSVVNECWPVGSATERVDIVVDGDSFTLFIEVKIQAQEGKEQLARYVKAAEAKRRATGKQHGLVLYLSPVAPVNPPDEVAFITWRNIGEILNALPKSGFNGAIIRQFSQHIQKFY